MIKKLQALKAKKGFTLVELIVVIAIIGVLAAILVPTMMGMVTKSRVTSADQTAKSLSDTVVTWMSDLESSGGKIPSGDVVVSIVGKCGVAAAGAADPAEWDGEVKADGFEVSGGGTDANDKAVDKLAKKIQDDYNFNTDISAIIIVSNRKVVGCAYVDAAPATATADGVAAALDAFDADTFRSGGYEWDGSTDGIYEEASADFDGRIIGTSPKLTMDKVSAT